jgi:hypothetical protein
VQTWGARIEAAVNGNGAGGEGLLQPFGVLMNEPAPRELVEHVFVI